MLVSCEHDYVYFDKPQPFDMENLNTIPLEYQGRWTDDGAIITINDTLFQLTEIRDDTLMNEEIYVLSDSVLVRVTKNTLVVNVKRKQWWEIFILKINKSSEIYGYYPNYEKISRLKNVEFIKKEPEFLAYIFYYEAEFSTKELEGLLRNKTVQLIVFRTDSTMSTEF